ncbi:DMT family transporter [Acrocarpospora catenulata]|uniref:DMT family transporter n=1 Tax=Acrocarpospora catenulata TaxID=2836182 RepID=UPI001BDB1576|nr:EamA family transporter [Acrocarpospora catenulata]
MTHVSVRQGLLYVSIAATAWGTGGAAGTLLDRFGGIGPITVSFWRFAIGAAILLSVSRLLRRKDLPAPGRALVTGVAMAVCQTAYFAAISESGLAVATVITAGSTPVLVAIGARVLLREHLSGGAMAAVLTAVTGLTILTMGDGLLGFSPAGVAWALVSAAGYSAVTLLGRTAPTDPYTTAMCGFTIGGLCLLPLALAQGLFPAEEALASWTLIAYLGAVPTALAYGLFFTGATALRATTASVITMIEPVGAAILGVLLFGEQLTLISAGGAGLLLAAAGLLAFSERRGLSRTV